MKTSSALIVLASCAASASAFAPSSTNNGARVSTELFEKKSLFRTIAEMDLFAPKANQNDYGARKSKNLKLGELGSNSYVPAGLTREQYDKIRKADAKKKADNYEKNIKKAGVFEDFTEWYKKRGTDTNQNWAKDTNLGHRMAKTKYDWSGDSDKPLWAKKK